MTDESTDNANVKQTILYLCGVKDRKPFCSFASLFAIPDGKAHTITEKILQFLGTTYVQLSLDLLFTDENDLDVRKFIGISTDARV